MYFSILSENNDQKQKIYIYFMCKENNSFLNNNLQMRSSNSYFFSFCTHRKINIYMTRTK